MAKVLIINAHPKTKAESNTLRLADEFMQTYTQLNPHDELITLNLYEQNLQHLDATLVDELFASVDNDVKRHAELFAAADKYVVIAPMWNLSIPAILKTYIDYISYVGITFKYTEHGPVGLLADKPRKLVHITSRGGLFSTGDRSQFEYGDRYLRAIFGFFGIATVETLLLEMTNMLPAEQLDGARNLANQQAHALAKSF
ncbi:MAG: FMN-dependent NADH-azoreductase [Culicoidibacterales bacterium]